MGVQNDIYAYLGDQDEIGGSTGWTGVINRLPESPDKVVFIKNTGGQPPEGKTSFFYHPSFQIIVRAGVGEDSDAESKIGSLRTLLHGIKNTTLNSVSYASIDLQGDLLSLGQDSQGRLHLSQNFLTGRNA